ncbi:MAG: ABC transporter ATP-binding protein [Rhodobacteraceae bacterium]|nr:ABC transporter ATP-binding protein [Paracoccaceae bacterium]
MSLLTVRNLGKSFGGVAATDGLSLSVDRGEIHAIIGPNGAGKTTLIAQLSGTMLPDIGTVRFNGRDITRLSAHARARLGLTRSFQITSLVPGMTALENVALAAQVQEGHSFRFLRPVARIESLRTAALDQLYAVGLGTRAEQPVTALSHGEHRLVEMAVVLATGALLLLLDEPFAGLGSAESARMVAFLKTLKGTRTILLIEHDMNAVFALADRISVLVRGRIIATGGPDAIRASPAVRAAYLGGD